MTQPKSGKLDGRKIPLDETIWKLPESDRSRILVTLESSDGTLRTVRPFRFAGSGAVELDDDTAMT